MPELVELKLMEEFINKHSNNTYTRIEKSNITKNFFQPMNGRFKIKALSRGKELCIFINDKKLFMTMGMSGNWNFSKVEDMVKHSHLNFYTDDGHALSFVDARRFGKWSFKDDWNKDRGYDILNETEKFVKDLKKNIAHNHKKFEKPISELMMDQKFFNGFGNYLRAEILDRLDTSPFIKAKHVLDEKFIDTCLQVLNESYSIGGGEMKTFINPNKDKKEIGVEFKNWLQCYGKKKKIIDNTGRAFWYDKKWDNDRI